MAKGKKRGRKNSESSTGRRPKSSGRSPAANKSSSKKSASNSSKSAGKTATTKRGSGSEQRALDAMLLNVLRSRDKRRKAKKKALRERAEEEGWLDEFLDDWEEFLDQEDDY